MLKKSTCITGFLFIVISTLFSVIGFAQVSFPAPDEIKIEFLKATNENQRYQLFVNYQKNSDLLSQKPNLKDYMATFKELITHSKTLNDSDWVYNTGLQLLKVVSDKKMNLLIDANGAIPLSLNSQEEFIYYFSMGTESYQHNYLSQTAIQSSLKIQETQSINLAYPFFEKIQVVLNHSEDYLQRDVVQVLSTLSFIYVKNYSKLEVSDLEVWLPRLSSDGMQKTLTLLENDILKLSHSEVSSVDKIQSISKKLHKLLLSKFSNDPFNEWQITRPLNILGSILKKSQYLEVPVDLDSVKYLAQYYEAVSFVNFCNELGIYIIQQKLVSKKYAAKLLPVYEYLNQTLNERKYLFETDSFMKAYKIIKTSLFSVDILEGEYQISNSKFDKLILAYKNERDITVGISENSKVINVAFDAVYLDEQTNYYSGKAKIGSTQFVIQLRINLDQTIEGSINGEFFKGVKVKKFKDYLTFLNETKNVNLNGSYSGYLRFSDGSQEKAKLLIVTVDDHFAGNLVMENNQTMPFEMGIHENTKGVLYLTTTLGHVSVVHLLRGVLNTDGDLEGVWFTTSRSEIAEFVLKKDIK